MEPTKEQTDAIPESSAAKLAFYFAWTPLVGWMLYMIFAFLGLIQIGRGRTGFNRLSRGLVAVLFLSVLPIAGLVWWARLPSEYYIALNKLTKHGCVSKANDQGQVKQREYFRFGKSFKEERYDYHENGTKMSEELYVDGKQHGKTSRWYDSGLLISETNYIDGFPEGTSFHWYNADMRIIDGNERHHGELRMIENFSKGKLHGQCSWYGNNGKLIRSMNYTDGISQEQIDAAKKAGVPVTIEEDLGGGVKMKMVFIPPGEFTMGSPDQEQGRSDDEGPQHKVIIKQGFYLSETELTQAQWKAVMGENPSYFKNGERGISKDTSNHPVETISWDNVQECLKKLDAKGKGGYRLPSEAEWEFAARANTTTRFGFGDSDDELGDYAWYWSNSGRTTHPVATRKSNNWGLFDMHGNVREWCEDDWHGNYAGTPSDGKAWNDSPRGAVRMFRGGAWAFASWFCRSAKRYGTFPVNLGERNGVRFARNP